MSTSNEQIRECEDSYSLFKTAVGESFAGYSTPSVEDANLRTMVEWGTNALPGGFQAFEQMGAFEIAFRVCAENGTLQRDPAWLSRAERKALFTKLNNTLPAEKAKALYFGQLASYNGLFTDEQTAQLNRIGGEAAFKMFVDEV